MSSFFANFGYDPRWTNDLTQPTDVPTRTTRPAYTIAKDLRDITDHLRAEMHRAQLRHQEYADASRTPAPILKVGNKVWLNAKNIITRRPSRKLDHRRLRPFPISKVISPWAYELELPHDMKIHPVQHVSLLDPAHDDPLPEQINPSPPSVEVNEKLEYHVESVLDSQIRRKRLE